MNEKIKSNLKDNYPLEEKPKELNIKNNYKIARKDKRGRTCKNMHSQGEILNRSFNFLTKYTFMKPHSHEDEGMIEEIKLIEGEIKIYFFRNDGYVWKTKVLAKPGDYVHVPTKLIHTYIVMTNEAVTYETMTGVYEKSTWKKFPEWAKELSEEGDGGKVNSEKLRLRSVNEKAY